MKRFFILFLTIASLLALSGCYYTVEDADTIRYNAQEEGYQEGYWEGYSRAQEEYYDQGYNEGYDDGYADGYSEGRIDALADYGIEE